jgi:hypothetical protein
VQVDWEIVMAIEVWVGAYVMMLGFWVWVAAFGGARWLEGSEIADWIHFSPEVMSADTLRGIGWVMVVGVTVWFVVGLVWPAARFLW